MATLKIRYSFSTNLHKKCIQILPDLDKTDSANIKEANREKLVAAAKWRKKSWKDRIEANEFKHFH